MAYTFMVSISYFIKKTFFMRFPVKVNVNNEHTNIKKIKELFLTPQKIKKQKNGGESGFKSDKECLKSTQWKGLRCFHASTNGTVMLIIAVF